MSWCEGLDMDGMYEAELDFLAREDIEVAEAVKTLEDSGLFEDIDVTRSHIPTKIFAVLKSTGQTCYIRDNRVGEDPTLYVFSEKVELPADWDKLVYQQQDKNEGWLHYPDLAKELIRMTTNYLQVRDADKGNDYL